MINSFWLILLQVCCVFSCDGNRNFHCFSIEKGDFKWELLTVKTRSQNFELGRSVVDSEAGTNTLGQLLIAQNQAKINRIWIFVTSAGGLFTIGIILWVLGRKTAYQRMQNKVAMLELRNRELESNQLKQELRSQKQDLLQIALDNTRKSDWAINLLESLESVAHLKEEERSAALRLLITDIRSQLHLEERTQLEQENIELVNQLFFARLIEGFPELSKSEKEICGLIRMGLSGKEIANVRNIHPKSVTKSKNRLRKKLGLEASQDINAFLLNF